MTTEAATPGGAGVGSGFDPAERRFSVGSAALTVALTTGVFLPVIYHMVRHWQIVGEYSHGFLIAPLAIYFAYEQRAELARTPLRPSWWGLVPLVLGVTALAVGRLGVELMAMRTGFLLTLNGLVLLLLGIQAYRVLLFPLWFSFLMVPLPQSLANTITFPMQLIATDLAMHPLYWLKIPALSRAAACARSWRWVPSAWSSPTSSGAASPSAV